MTKHRMIELWINEDGKSFGIKLAGEQEFKAVSGRNPSNFIEIVDSSTFLEDVNYNWYYTLSKWVYLKYGKRVKGKRPSAGARVSARIREASTS